MTDQRHELEWTFLSNHSHVLYCISSFPEIRIREIADMVRITERAVQRIVVDLERGGYLKRQRVGRRNHYRVKPGLHLRHPLERHVEVGRLLTVLQPARTSPRKPTGSARRQRAMPVRSNARSIAAAKKGHGQGSAGRRSGLTVKRKPR